MTIIISGGGSSGTDAPTAPQGRLTLTTATPVLVSTVSGATTIFYTPYAGEYVPIYNGTSFTMTDTGGELSQATTDTTKSPAAVTTNSNYDLFVWSDSGTIRCTRGPAWTSSTARGTGVGTTELVLQNGIYLNKNAITNGPGASRGTYVGTVRSNASSQIDYIFGAAASGGTAGSLGVWNAYNRVTTSSVSQDNKGTNWTYASATIQQLDNSTGNQTSFILGLAEDAILADALQQLNTGATASAQGTFGVEIDSTTTYSAAFTKASETGAAAVGSGSCSFAWVGKLGWHTVSVNQSSEVGTTTYIGSVQARNALRVTIRN